LDQHTRTQQDLAHLGHVIDQKVSFFSWPPQLRFRNPPSSNQSYISEFTISSPSNKGVCALEPRKDASTLRLLTFEDGLLDSYFALESLDTLDDQILKSTKQAHMNRIVSSLRHIDVFKRWEWDRQRAVPLNEQDRDVSDAMRINTGINLISPHLKYINCICSSISSMRSGHS